MSPLRVNSTSVSPSDSPRLPLVNVKLSGFAWLTIITCRSCFFCIPWCLCQLWAKTDNFQNFFYSFHPFWKVWQIIMVKLGWWGEIFRPDTQWWYYVDTINAITDCIKWSRYGTEGVVQAKITWQKNCLTCPTFVDFWLKFIVRRAVTASQHLLGSKDWQIVSYNRLSRMFQKILPL